MLILDDFAVILIWTGTIIVCASLYAKFAAFEDR